MSAFAQLSPETRHLLAGALFLAVTAQLALCLYQQLCFSPRRRRLLDAGLLLAPLLALACLTALAGDAGAGGGFPWLSVPLAAALLALHAGLGIRRTWRERRETLTPDSIQEALDNLNAGLLFTDETGKTVLINRTMGALAAGLIGSYPQLLEELRRALAAPPAESGAEKLDEELCRFPDGRVWRFQTVPLTEPELSGFLQTTAQDVTELYAVNAQLARDNEALRAAIGRMRGMVDRLSDLVREQETLNLKIRIHNDIGSSLIALSGLADGGGREDTEKQLQVLERALVYFGSDYPAAEGTLEAVRRQAAEMGVTLETEGYLPHGGALEELVAAAARECVTNCVRHARGSRVTVRLSERGGVYTAAITNDGQVPAGPIAEGGGLSALRRRVEGAGGEMHLAHAPRFALILNLTERKPEL